MRWVVSSVLVLSGCSSILGIEDFKLADAGTDTRPDGDMGFCLGPDGWRVCLPNEPEMPRTVTESFTLPTQGPICAPVQPPSWKAAGQPDACFVIGSDITFAAPTVQATGERPLVIFASGTIHISTQLDVSSHSNVRGPGVPAAACVPPQPPGSTSSSTPAGGAAGASFMGRGGRGGVSSANVAGGVPAGADSSGPNLLRAGCNGGLGGASGNGIAGAGGAGGGAVYLVAGKEIVIDGFINASGTGGGGGGLNAGGGGGGSGGMIVLHAPVIRGNGGVLIANGGGGGGGGGSQQSGARGADPSPQMPALPASGGVGPGGATAGAGGSGFAGTSLAKDGNGGPASTAVAGGGGGGAQGYIRANVMPSQIMQSPTATIVPTSGSAR